MEQDGQFLIVNIVHVSMVRSNVQCTTTVENVIVKSGAGPTTIKMIEAVQTADAPSVILTNVEIVMFQSGTRDNVVLNVLKNVTLIVRWPVLTDSKLMSGVVRFVSVWIVPL